MYGMGKCPVYKVERINTQREHRLEKNPDGAFFLDVISSDKLRDSQNRLQWAQEEVFIVRIICFWYDER